MNELTPPQKELFDWLKEYISTNKYSPSIREMMIAMNLRSPAPIQHRLAKMRNKGYVEWMEGQARTLQIVKDDDEELFLTGEVTEGGIVQSLEDKPCKLSLPLRLYSPEYFVLQAKDASLIPDNIVNGDYLIMSSMVAKDNSENGLITAINIEGEGTMIKKVYYEDDKITLKSCHSDNQSITLYAKDVTITGVLVSIYRAYS